MREYRLKPSEYDLAPASAEDMAGGDAARNAEVMLTVISGKDRGPRRDLVAWNAAIRIYLSERAGNIAEGLTRAQEALNSGAVREKLEALQKRAASKVA